MKHRISVILFILLNIFIASCSTTLTPEKVSKVKNNGNDYVIMLHGLWNSSSRMEDFEEYFLKKNYQVFNLDYPSTEFQIEKLDTKYLKPIIESVPLHTGQKIHFITHSMGGLLLRHYLTHNELPQLGRVVMISPPNHGSEWADILDNHPVIKSMVGPAANELKTRNNTFLNKLGAVDYHLGIIAGDKSYTDMTEEFLPGADDGMVPVSRMKVRGMKDFIILHDHHRGLTWNPDAMKQAEMFIKTGRFIHSENMKIAQNKINKIAKSTL